MNVNQAAAVSREPGPLARAGVLDEAQVYDAMWRSTSGNCGPRDVDEMFIWEIATLLQVDDEIDRGTSETSSKTGGGRPSADDHEYLRARLRYSKGEGPKPEAKAIRPEALAALGEALA